MNKKIIISIVLIVFIGVCIILFWHHLEGKENLINNDSNDNKNEKDNTNKSNIVIYFSETGNTKKVAEMIGTVIDSPVISIIPKDEYTLEDIDYTSENSRANKEQQNPKARPEIANKIDITNYDTIYLGYPIWWGDVPKIILTLIDTYDFRGKTIIPFCTSGSSGISTRINTLRKYNSNMTVLNGKRFSTSVTKEEISTWINENE